MAPRAASKTAETSDKVSVICRALRRAIIEQALEPGAKLPEDSLGERFGVSRTIARHALGQLAAEGLVELRRNRIAVVATPSWQDARDAFDVRIQLERLVVRQLAGKLTKAQIAELSAHVDAEDRARGGSDPVSIRLATEFHILLAHMTNSPVLIRYVSEIAYRCCLTLSLFSRPHSSECAINEHRAIIAALVRGDEEKVMSLMHSHLDSVAGRALVAPVPQRGRDLIDILAPYAEAAEGSRVVKLPKAARGR
ncbi:GntR family transcriptional regulator [Bradyrhizobium neotropicale]|uniref:GntR family transcriptional regulator n=1 Tax=Bradyrhizobium neotropicale TaxID=1497615 RepID=UPI001AD7E4F9|nr:GntR family transcriptional regulator [Bradyrhizobium neotropicale]MBO4223709.1 FCD domain-containing protein [Bradyrhizobium neotropicale]